MALDELADLGCDDADGSAGELLVGDDLELGFESVVDDGVGHHDVQAIAQRADRGDDVLLGHEFSPWPSSAAAASMAAWRPSSWARMRRPSGIGKASPARPRAARGRISASGCGFVGVDSVVGAPP